MSVPERSPWIFYSVRRLRLSFFSLRPRQIERMAGLLRRGAEDIPHCVKSLETQYLGMQKGLGELGPAARDLVERGERLVDLASGRDTAQANIERAVALINSVLDSLALTQNSLSRLIAELREAIGGIQEVLRVEKNLAHAIAPLDYVQVMLRIEAAGLPPVQQEVFADLTGEIAALCERARKFSAANVEAIAGLEELLRSGIQSVEKRHLQRQRALETRRAEIAGALGRLAADIERNAGRKLEISSAISGIVAEVNAAIMALQTQDIVAQRLEHTRSGLLEAEQSARHFARSRRPGDALRVKAILRVESEQIGAIGNDMQRAEFELNRAVAAIHSHLRAFDSDFLTMREFSEITASVNGIVQILLDSFSGARELACEAAASIGDVENLIRPCESLTRNVTSTVQELSVVMRIIALNAQIHAIKIGSGTGLEVLAAHTAAISAATTEIGGDAGDGVAGIMARLQSVLSSLDILRSEFHEEQEQLGGAASVEVGILHGFRNSALSEVHQIGAALQRARDASSSLLAGANCSAATGLLTQLRADAVALERGLGRGIDAPTREMSVLTAGLRSKYSMSRERVTHDHAIGEEASACSAAETTSPAAIVFADGAELF